MLLAGAPVGFLIEKVHDLCSELKRTALSCLESGVKPYASHIARCERRQRLRVTSGSGNTSDDMPRLLLHTLLIGRISGREYKKYKYCSVAQTFPLKTKAGGRRSRRIPFQLH